MQGIVVTFQPAPGADSVLRVNQYMLHPDYMDLNSLRDAAFAFVREKGLDKKTLAGIQLWVRRKVTPVGETTPRFLWMQEPFMGSWVKINPYTPR